jgi:hypothetical protein
MHEGVDLLSPGIRLRKDISDVEETEKEAHGHRTHNQHQSVHQVRQLDLAVLLQK